MTVPKGAPKHIEWGDRMAQALQVIAADTGTIVACVKAHPDSFKMSYVIDSFERITVTLADLDKVRDEIINSENLEEELHDLIESIKGWSMSQLQPATLIYRAQSAQRVLDRIVHVGETSGG